ncbi:predicted protein, partial [Nematostella vectensis]
QAKDCYNEFNRAQLCQPAFHDLAYNKDVYVSHTCGEKSRRFCPPMSVRGRTACGFCDERNAKTSHPAKYLTDVHNENNVTCWQADPVQSRENVTLILSFGKTYDITYVSLQFCGIRPDSMGIYKSMDYGKSWQAYQFYSSRCEKMYGRVTNGEISPENEQVALCTDGHLLRPLYGGRIAFSTLEGRPSASKMDYSAVMQEWVMATDIKVEFNMISRSARPRDSLYYAVSEFNVGGRCHCNGHASECVSDRNGRQVCDCKHNTVGVDCGACRPFFNDRPWRPATHHSANECKMCNCNLHARTCVFSMELFKLSGGRSGGVCVKCRHNTAGRYCHYCREGFYKDPNKHITHIKVCRQCNCHPHGSRGRVCNQSTGQCPCKEGVVGRSCDKCAPGYKSTKSNIVPCIETPNVVMSQESSTPRSRDQGCSQCRRVPLKVKRFCRKDFALKVTVVRVEKKLPNSWVRATVNINTLFKRSRTRRVRRGDGYVWIKKRDFRCRCPKLKPGRSYFIAGNLRGQSRKRSIVLNGRSVVLPWNEKLLKRIYRFIKLQRNNNC